MKQQLELLASTSVLRVAALIAIVVAGPSLLIVAGCEHGTARLAPNSVTPTADAGFVGNEACAECHPREFGQHRGSRHDTTMRVAGSLSLAGQTPPPGRIPDSVYAIGSADARLTFERSDRPEVVGPIDVVMGSGKSGMTYLGGFDATGLTEYRMSYVPTRRSWYVTPGHETATDLELGNRHGKSMARRCILCHGIALTAGSFRPESRFTGVGCESCHGPGSAHVNAAKTRGTTGLKVDKIGSWGARRINALCARCHRAAVDVPLASVDASSTHRFQPYGLEASPCFKRSGDRLSCLSCHDAHTDVAMGEAPYVPACLRCHSSTSTPAARGNDARPQVCPVNPRGKCIGCHMPKRQMIPGSQIKVQMADHLIWAYRGANEKHTDSGKTN